MKRRFFFCEVPVRYYPLAVFVLFAVLGGGPSLAFAISMGVGYLFGQGRLDHVLRLSSNKAKDWENGVLSSFTSQPGWVYGHAALGSDAWSQLPTNDTGTMVSCHVIYGCKIPMSFARNLTETELALQGSSLFRSRPGPTADTDASPSVGSVIVRGNRQSSTSSNNPVDTTPFAGSTGHTLGGGSTNRRKNETGAAARAARLQALERRGDHAV